MNLINEHYDHCFHKANETYPLMIKQLHWCIARGKIYCESRYHHRFIYDSMPLYCQFQLLSNQKKKKEKKLDALCAYDLPLSNIKKRRKMQDLDVNNARCLSLSLYKKRDIYTFGIND